MERKSPFIEGFIKAANLAASAKSLGRKALLIGGLGAGAYGAGKVISKLEDPEQKKLRELRRLKALPYQQGGAV